MRQFSAVTATDPRRGWDGRAKGSNAVSERCGEGDSSGVERRWECSEAHSSDITTMGGTPSPGKCFPPNWQPRPGDAILCDHVGMLIFASALSSIARAATPPEPLLAQWLGSVCAGAFLLGRAGVLDGKQATTWFGGETSLQTEFPKIEVIHDKPVVLDKRRITANGGLVSYRAALVLLGQMTSAQHTKEVYENLGMERLGTWAEIEANMNERPS